MNSTEIWKIAINILCMCTSSHPLPRISHYNMKWIKQIRALPSDAMNNDNLKIEYLDVNLNNSRNLIAGVNAAAAASDSLLPPTEAVLEDMLRLRNVREELSWVSGSLKNGPGTLL